MMNIIYIDAQNIHKSLEYYHGRKLDWVKFYRYSQERFDANEVKIFFGYMKKYNCLYKKLENIGYKLCFKETMILPNSDTKGNVDIDIAISATKDYYEGICKKGYLFTGDGDYNSLIYFWKDKCIFGELLIPGSKNSSKLLFKSAGSKIVDI